MKGTLLRVFVEDKPDVADKIGYQHSIFVRMSEKQTKIEKPCMHNFEPKSHDFACMQGALSHCLCPFQHLH